MLNRAQQFHLQVRRHFGNLIKEKRAAFRSLKEADVIAHRTREGAALVAEQLAFQQRFAQRAAIHRDEGITREGAAVVDGTRHQFLAGAAFAGDQHSAAIPCHHANHLQHVLDCRRTADDLMRIIGVAQLCLQLPVLAAQVLHFQRARHDDQDFLRIGGLDQVVHRASLHGLHGGLD